MVSRIWRKQWLVALIRPDEIPGNRDADFYEDALASAGRRPRMLEAAKEGRVIAGKAHAKKQQKEGTLKGWGASVFFTKEIYCRKRTAKFGIITNTMLFYLLVQCRYFPVLCQDHGGVRISGAGLYFVFCTFLPEYGKSDCTGGTARNWLFFGAGK